MKFKKIVPPSNDNTPIIVQDSRKVSIGDFGGMAIYQSEFSRAVLEVDVTHSLFQNFQEGELLYKENHSIFFEACWKMFLRILNRILKSPLSILGSVSFWLIQIYLTKLFSKHKSSRKNVIYHHLSNFAFPEFALIQIAKKYNVFLLVTVIDLLEVDYPVLLPASTRKFRTHLKNFFKSSAYFFIPISNFIQRDALDCGLIPNSEKSEVIQLGADHLLVPQAVPMSPDTRKKYLQELKISQPFFLFPAKVWAHKGHLNFLKAYLDNDQAIFNVVLIGDNERLRPEMENLISLMGKEKAQKIRNLGFVDGEIHNMLMHECQAVILPSCYEGFGFPYFESTLLKKPFVAFRTKSYLEFFEDLQTTLSVANENFAEFIQALVQFNGREAMTETKRRYALVQELTWATCFSKSLNIYSKVLNDISLSKLI